MFNMLVSLRKGQTNYGLTFWIAKTIKVDGPGDAGAIEWHPHYGHRPRIVAQVKTVRVIVQTVGDRATGHNRSTHQLRLPPWSGHPDLAILEWFAFFVRGSIAFELIHVLGASVVKMVLVVISQPIVQVYIGGECLLQPKLVPAHTFGRWPRGVEALAPVVQYLRTRSRAVERHAEGVVQLEHLHIVGHEQEAGADHHQADGDDHKGWYHRRGRHDRLPGGQPLLAEVGHISDATENVAGSFLQLGRLKPSKHFG